MELKHKNILVTGGFGFVGSNLVQRLFLKNNNIVCLRRDKVTNYPPTIKIVDGDVTDLELMKRIVTDYEIDVIFHLAAQAIVDIAVKNPMETLKTNIMGTINILEAARIGNVRAVIIASSDKAYGEGKIPYTEDMPLKGMAPYDVSKSCADLIAMAYYKTYDLPVVITRCANIYGPNDSNFNRLIPGAIKAALNNEDLILRSNGKYIRDFLFVDDAVSGYIACAEQIDFVKGNAFNFGTEGKHTVIEIANMIYWLCKNKTNKIIIKNTAKHEIKDQYLDCTKAKKMLGWKPKYTIEWGLKETIEWYKGTSV